MKRATATAILILASVILQFLARKTEWFAEWYSVRVYPKLVGTVGRFFSLFPFSAAELLLYAAAAGVVLWILFSMIWLAVKRKKGVRTVLNLSVTVFFTASLLLFLYTANCGINYYRLPFSVEAGIAPRESSKEELYELCGYLLDKINENAALIDKDAYGRSTIDEAAVRREAVKEMQKLGERYPSLDGYYARPKAVLFSDFLSCQEIQGIYSPFTIEANYNSDVPAYNIPVTICHELSHLRGFMREDEANFIAYLACRDSLDPQFRYSGYMLAYIHSSNALYNSKGEAEYRMLWDRLDATARADYAYNNEYWDRYKGKIAEISNQVNDSYLKINDQEEGIKSYGRMVDLLLADYRSNPPAGQ